MVRVPLRWLVASSVLALVADSTPSHACSCGYNEPWFLPASGATEVPVNLRELYFDARLFQPTAELRDETGALVPLGPPVEEPGHLSPRLYRTTLLAALQPAHEYRLTVRDSSTASFVSTFTTGAQADTTPPGPIDADRLLLAYSTYVEGLISSCGQDVVVVRGRLRGFDPAGLVVVRLVGTDSDETRVLRPHEYALSSLGMESCRVQLPVAPCADYSVEISARDAAGNEGATTRHHVRARGCGPMTDSTPPEACIAGEGPETCPGTPPADDDDGQDTAAIPDTRGCSASHGSSAFAAFLLLLTLRRKRS